MCKCILTRFLINSSMLMRIEASLRLSWHVCHYNWVWKFSNFAIQAFQICRYPHSKFENIFYSSAFDTEINHPERNSESIITLRFFEKLDMFINPYCHRTALLLKLIYDLFHHFQDTSKCHSEQWYYSNGFDRMECFGAKKTVINDQCCGVYPGSWSN